MDCISIREIINDNNLKIVAGNNGLDATCKEIMISRPGLEFTGFFDFFDENRIILLGSKEVEFLKKNLNESILDNIDKIFQKNPPCFIFSKNAEVLDIFIEYANKYNVCLLKSELRTTPTSAKIFDYLQEKLAPMITVHGCLVDINGVGTLITGKSGIGKSEITLDLIKKGHQLIADDSVEIIEKEPGNLIGTAPVLLRRFIEIRGIGVVDVVSVFGAGAYSSKTKIDLVVELEMWDETKIYDRIGLESNKISFFNTELPKVVIPVSPGRSVSLLVDIAAMNEKLKSFGYNAAVEFVKKVDEEALNGGRKDV